MIDQRIENQSILDELKDSYLNYAMSVIVSRALPDVRDGLKPSQRRIMVAMNDLNLGPRSKHRKCAKIAGDTSGNYHPHGESVVYPTLVRMGQKWNMSVPLINPQGNFGSIDGDPPAAMRYTEARMTAAASEILADLKLDTVDFIPNYDETMLEPTVLPCKFPNLLVNGSYGIAVGMATSIPPHNPTEVCEALLKVIDNPDCSISEILEVMPGPDFPTGGTICGRKGIVDGYSTGRGLVTLRGKVHTEEKGKKTIIVIDEIPYQTIKSNIVIKIADCVTGGIIPEITDVRDESDRKGLRVVVELRREADPEVVINQLYKYTPLQNTFSIINIALVKNRPQTLSIKQMLSYFLDHRKDVIRRRTMHLLKKAQRRAHLVEGLLLAQSDIDEIIEIIKASANPADAKTNLMAKALRLVEHETLKRLLPEEFVNEKSNNDQFLSGPQADAILIMQLQRLTGLEIEKLANEFAALNDEINGYKAILSQENLLLDIIREDLHEMKEKYGIARRTDIIGEITDFDLDDLIAEEEMVVTISHSGYIKRMPIDTYRAQGRGGRGIKGAATKDADFLEHLFTASTHDYMCCFTNQGRCHWLRVYSIPLLSRQSQGRNLANLIEMEKDEKIAQILPVREFDERSLVIATQMGIIKKSPLSAYGNIRKKGIIAINLDEGDNVIGANITTGDDQIILGTSNGKSIRFHEDNLRSMGRTSRGVKGITLKGADQVVDMIVTGQDKSLLTICENGYGKKTNINDYRSQNRGGSGIINIKCTERNGQVVALKAVEPDDDIMMVSSNGIIIRTSISQLSDIGRNTQGVRLIKLDKGDTLVAVARVDKSDEEDETEIAELPTGTADQVPMTENEATAESTEKPPIQPTETEENGDQDE
ncbi:MAG: DNA gyrase subunit A [Phycisphaerae bacterium]|nr:DNA gyrase subunit A [Phycisphaerae bacterium]